MIFFDIYLFFSNKKISGKKYWNSMSLGEGFFCEDIGQDTMPICFCSFHNSPFGKNTCNILLTYSLELKLQATSSRTLKRPNSLKSLALACFSLY
jgi:hypothetical protein